MLTTPEAQCRSEGSNSERERMHRRAWIFAVSDQDSGMKLDWTLAGTGTRTRAHERGSWWP